MVQCVPELPVVSTPVEDKTKVSEVKHGPRVKVTPTRKDIAQKIQRKKVKGSKKTTSVTPHVAGGESVSITHRYYIRNVVGLSLN